MPLHIKIREDRSIYRGIGMRVRSRRKYLRLTQQIVAEDAGMSRASLVNIEYGRQRLTIAALYALADALIITPGQLLPEMKDLP